MGHSTIIAEERGDFWADGQNLSIRKIRTSFLAAASMWLTMISRQISSHFVHCCSRNQTSKFALKPMGKFSSAYISKINHLKLKFFPPKFCSWYALDCQVSRKQIIWNRVKIRFWSSSDVTILPSMVLPVEALGSGGRRPVVVCKLLERLIITKEALNYA